MKQVTQAVLDFVEPVENNCYWYRRHSRELEGPRPDWGLVALEEAVVHSSSANEVHSSFEGAAANYEHVEKEGG